MHTFRETAVTGWEAGCTLPGDEQNATDDGQNVTGDEQNVTGDGQNGTGDGQNGTDDGQGATGDGENATGDGENAADDGESAADDGDEEGTDVDDLLRRARHAASDELREGLYRRILQLDEHEHHAMVGLARILMDRGENTEAATLLRGRHPPPPAARPLPHLVGRRAGRRGRRRRRPPRVAASARASSRAFERPCSSTAWIAGRCARIERASLTNAGSRERDAQASQSVRVSLASSGSGS